MAQATVTPPTLLMIPFEIRTRIYKEVFAGSEMHFKSVGKGRVRCTNPEHYRVLRTCKQVEAEGSIVLAALTKLFVKSSDLATGRLKDMLRCCHSYHAPRFLRQSIPYLRNLRVDLYADNYATLVTNLVQFVQLREIRISTMRSMDDCVPDSILKCPLLLLGTAGDKIFVMTLQRCLTKVVLDHTKRFYIGANATSHSPRAFRAMVNEPLDELRDVTDPKGPYDILWEGQCSFELRPSIWLPLAQGLCIHLEMKYVANLGANTIVSKMFRTSIRGGMFRTLTRRGWTEDPRELLRWFQDDTRGYWTPGAVAQTTLPE